MPGRTRGTGLGRLLHRTGRRTRRRAGLAGVAAVAAGLLLAACTGPEPTGAAAGTGTGSGGGAVSQPSHGGRLHFAVITHAAPGDSFWSVVKNGAVAAGKQLGVEVDYQNDPDPGNQARLIDNAVAQHVDGLVVSMANPAALHSAISAAEAQHIPVVTINSGEQQSKAYGAIGHVGQDEYIAGQGAGAQLKKLGVQHALCVIHEAGNVGLSQRCQGAANGFGGKMTNLQVDINNPTQIVSRITAALQADSSIDGILTLNAQVAANAVQGAQAAGALSRVKIGTFDVNPDVLNSIKAGKVDFAVDQQQYEQGYLPIVMLKLYIENGNTVGGGQPVLTGPAIVDRSNADQVAKYAARGTR
ncbi:sugar ABC transporter substrate-binding protein [Phaeacidiphilus oryzae]|uniref:sugar ABC transporter substrate-binding protein n=1 Tax=Phaeacidiphilus oryzae TaxID=348818 RepID=UPI000B2ADCE8|nr:sugar ABC transporter substrate-binding protein [Phaeacidiphilus oryzae]